MGNSSSVYVGQILIKSYHSPMFALKEADKGTNSTYIASKAEYDLHKIERMSRNLSNGYKLN